MSKVIARLPHFGQHFYQIHRIAASFNNTSLVQFSSCKTNMASSKHAMAKRLEGTDKNVWVEFGKLAAETKALNLGQGFPDFHPPEHFKESLITAIKSENALMHQYARSFGHPRLINALSKTFSPLLQREIDPMTEILITVGAYGSLFCAVQGLVNPGDEVIIIEPFFDCYEPMVKVAGGTPVFVPLRPTDNDIEKSLSSGDWKLDPQELASKFNSNTKAIIVNNPNNPLGKVFKRDELQMIADLTKKHDAIVISDEVYEWMIYDENQHIRIATLPGMWDRTVTIGSAGKTFSVTGWKTGWSIGPKHLIHPLQTVHQNCSYTCPTPIQEAVAVNFENEQAKFGKADCYFQALAAELLPKRDMVAAFLREAGMKPVIPEGGYFMIADFSNLDFPYDPQSSESKDYQFVKWMARNKKLAAIPPSAFYSSEHKALAKNLIRFCFIKEDSSLEKAAKIMKDWKL